uniref:Uncharacterized protein n=1 Tax=Meloidogyne enterolobii TaxID=390850 RepID=A0A6V7VX13_MELEN|nr:unnamed protein product [Meloidogyne enterolobii]
MTEEGLNADLGLKLNKRIDDLIKLHTEFNNLQIKFNEENERIVNLEKKNNSLENELNETKKKIEKLKIENDLKDDKINSLEVQIKKANDSFNKIIDDLIIKVDNSVFNFVKFVKIKNKWKEIDSEYKCCGNNCINTNNPVGNCINKWGFGNIINDENVKYINNLSSKEYDRKFRLSAENPFKKPQNSFDYYLHYFEIKCKIERDLNIDWMYIGLKNLSTNKCIEYSAKYATINNENGSFKLSTTFNNNDIFGCGLVYPPTNKLNEEFPYVFFTQNGKQIGKGVLLTGNSDSYKPEVFLNCCSVETNFGNNLETKPFKYNISKHVIIKEFY